LNEKNRLVLGLISFTVRQTPESISYLSFFSVWLLLAIFFGFTLFSKFLDRAKKDVTDFKNIPLD
jgi:hypothetical protein